MSNNLQQPEMLDVEAITPHFGTRLKSTRESRGLERQDVAAQLRLSERMINMMESETYPPDLPFTFFRGYIRAYSKLLDIPEKEIQQALEPMHAIETADTKENLISPPITSGNYSMKLITALIVITLISLVAIWWHSHTKEPQLSPMAENILKLRGAEENTNIQNEKNQSINNISQHSADNSTANSTANKLTEAVQVKHAGLHNPSTLIIGNHHLMQFFTHFMLFILIGLIAYCWHHYRVINQLTISENENENDNDSDTTAPQYNLAIQAPDANILSEATTVNRMRIFSALIIFSITSLFSIWWISYLLLFAPTHLTASKQAEDNFAFSAKEPFLDVTRPSIPITIHTKDLHKKITERINSNTMKKIAPTEIEKYTPTPITHKSIASSKINTPTSSKKGSE